MVGLEIDIYRIISMSRVQGVGGLFSRRLYYYFIFRKSNSLKMNKIIEAEPDLLEYDMEVSKF